MRRALAAVAALSVGGVVAQEVKSLNAAGATFPVPLYTKIFSEYAKSKGVQVNYQGIGSGGGKTQITNQTVDFAGSDAPMSDAELKASKGRILHIPMALGAVVPTYNLPGVEARLRFSGEVLADVYLGKVNKWNDPAIAKLNDDVKLPNLPITVVRRSDGSGTTSIWVDFLAKASSEWAGKVSKGPQTSVNWPTGLGGQGNAGVAGLVRQTPGSIGYVEIAFARQNKLAVGLVQNASGKFVDANDLKTVAAAAASKPLPGDTRVSLTNAGGNAYPVAGFTWVLVYQDQKYGNRSEAHANAVNDLLWWMVHDGQKFSEALDYGELPDTAVTRAEALLKSMTYGGKKLR
jgi:phosphate transport system substrate-binding protein